MRRILLDHAKARGRLKRAGPNAGAAGRARLELAGVADLAADDPHEIVVFDEAFCRLECEAPDAAAVVRLRFWAGLSTEQTAAALGVSPSTVDRTWAFARAWLYRWLTSHPPDDP
jgi:DNA-directed RNA polymerase specialized sigma24 family protein